MANKYWDNLNDVPDSLREHSGSSLTIEQVHEVVDRALEIGDGQINLGLGAAWDEFRKNYSILGRCWVTNAVYLKELEERKLNDPSA